MKKTSTEIKNIFERVQQLSKTNIYYHYNKYYGYSIYQIIDGAIYDVFGLSSIKTYKCSEFISLLNGIIAGLENKTVEKLEINI
jgi:hypothetical protein